MLGGTLNCNATNCVHNLDCECKAGAINISGQSAVSTSGTTCTTFVDKAKSSFVNSVDDLTADIPYTKGVNYTSVLDGFIVSDNVTATAENIDADFMYSDHNPVKLTFKLN